MKLTNKNLAPHLNSPLKPLYWVCGDEPLLSIETSDAIRYAAKQQGFKNSEIFYVETDFNWDRLIAEARMMSLFADKTLIEIRLGDKKLSELARKLLQQYLESPSPEKIILLIGNKLESATLKTKWFQAIERASVLVQVWSLSLNELSPWVNRHLQKESLTINNDGMKLLIEKNEGNLLALKQDIEKLSLLYPNSTISIEQLQAAISDNAHFDLFSLVDAAVSGNILRSLRILTGLRQEGTEGILVLWALSREIRMLTKVAETIKLGQSFEQALRANGVWPRRMPIVKQALRRFPGDYWLQLLENALTIDLIIKGCAPGNVWDELEQLVTKF